jgi:hypothetical protein
MQELKRMYGKIFWKVLVGIQHPLIWTSSPVYDEQILLPSFFRSFFDLIMPEADILHKKLQSRNKDMTTEKTHLQLVQRSRKCGSTPHMP